MQCASLFYPSLQLLLMLFDVLSFCIYCHWSSACRHIIITASFYHCIMNKASACTTSSSRRSSSLSYKCHHCKYENVALCSDALLLDCQMASSFGIRTYKHSSLTLDPTPFKCSSCQRLLLTCNICLGSTDLHLSKLPMFIGMKGLLRHFNKKHPSSSRHLPSSSMSLPAARTPSSPPSSFFPMELDDGAIPIINNNAPSPTDARRHNRSDFFSMYKDCRYFSSDSSSASMTTIKPSEPSSSLSLPSSSLPSTEALDDLSNQMRDLSLSNSFLSDNYKRFLNSLMDNHRTLSADTDVSNDGCSAGGTMESASLETVRQLVRHVFSNAPSVVSPSLSCNYHGKAGVNETLFYLTLSSLSLKLTKEKFHLVFLLVKILVKAFAEDPNNNPFQCTSFPNAFQDLYNRIKTSNKSFLHSFPYNKPQALNWHAATGPISALECIMASGVELPDLATSYVGTFPAAVTLIEKASRWSAIPLGFGFFSDGFQNNAVVRDKGSQWLQALMLFASDKIFKVSHRYFRILVLGSDSMSHEEALDYVMDDLEKLFSGPRLMYVGAIGRCIPIMFDLLYYSSDIPERCKLLCVTTFASPSHRRFGHGMYIPNRDWWKFYLHSCPTCHSNRSRKIVESIIIGKCVAAMTFSSCVLCSDFDYNRERNKTKSSLIDNYPTSLLDDSPPTPPGRGVGKNVSLGECHPTPQNTKTAAECARHNHSKGHWGTQTTECFLRLCCCNTQLQTVVIKTPPTEEMKLPRIINKPTLKMNLFVESLMHLLFEGILGKSLIGEIANNLLFKQYGIGPKTNKSINDFYVMVKKASLNWLPIHPLAEAKDNAGNNTTYSCSGWQGVNFIAAARLLPISYSIVRSVLYEKNKFRTHPEKDRKEFELDLFELIIQTFHSIAARLMQNKINKELTDETRECVEFSLSICCRCSQLTECLTSTEIPSTVNKSTARTQAASTVTTKPAKNKSRKTTKKKTKKRKDPFPFRGMNYLNLLNFRDQILHHGPPRETWDGNCERTIQYVKPVLKGLGIQKPEPTWLDVWPQGMHRLQWT